MMLKVKEKMKMKISMYQCKLLKEEYPFYVNLEICFQHNKQLAWIILIIAKQMIEALKMYR